MNTKIKNIIAFLVVMIAIAGFIWFALNFGGGGEKVQSEQPLVICNPPSVPPEQQTCYWTAHIHFTLKVLGEAREIPLGFELGDLRAMHTHAEKETVHWHGLIPVNPKTKEVTDWSILRVEKIPGDLKVSTEGTPRFIVNSKEVEPSYTWKDGDSIEIHYE